MLLRSQKETKRMSYQVEGAPNLLRDRPGQIVLPCEALTNSRSLEDPMLISAWLCLAR